MLHTDGYILYSNTIYIKKDDAPQRMFIYPNPFGSNMTITFARTTVQPVTFSFYDAGGKLVKRYSAAPGAVTYDINTTGILSRAIYVLKVNVDGRQLTERVMKQ